MASQEVLQRAYKDADELAQIGRPTEAFMILGAAGVDFTTPSVQEILQKALNGAANTAAIWRSGAQPGAVWGNRSAEIGLAHALGTQFDSIDANDMRDRLDASFHELGDTVTLFRAFMEDNITAWNTVNSFLTWLQTNP